MKNNTLDKKEIEKFSKIAEEWWNPTGKFKPLHKFNPIRIRYIKNNTDNEILKSLKFNKQILSLPIGEHLNLKDIKYVCKKIKKFFDD